MVKLLALYRKPPDPKTFEEYYFKQHKPLAEKIPYLKAYKLYRVIGTPKGSTTDFYFLAELEFENREVMLKALRSPESLTAAKDVPQFARDIVSIFFVEETETPVSA
ncbi:MAG: EthD family reductase [Elusimicrobia bacterium]|nr:EthD family reductase [Elusimicrobiota bacterium]